VVYLNIKGVTSYLLTFPRVCCRGAGIISGSGTRSGSGSWWFYSVHVQTTCTGSGVRRGQVNGFS